MAAIIPGGRGGAVTLGFVARLAEPAYGAAPIRPLPVNALMRWFLVGSLVAYAALGQIIHAPEYVLPCLSFVVGMMLWSELRLLRARDDNTRLLRVWATTLFLDVAVVMVAGTLDKNEFSPVPMLAVASVFTASAMFNARYVMALAVFAAVLAPLTHVAHDVAEGQFTFWSQGFVAAVILGSGGFAATRGKSESDLRRQLTTSEARERDQAGQLREALAAARVAQSRFEALSSHAPAVIALYDRDGRMTFGSRYLATAFGVPLEQIGEVDFWGTRVAPDELADVTAIIQAAAGGSVYAREFTVLTATGESRRMSAVFFPTEEGAGAIFHDVTAERLLALQVQRAQQMETLGTLAGGVAHDFNNLLTTILGNAHLALLEAGPASPVEPMLNDIRVAGERGADLVRRLMEYGRPGYDAKDEVGVAHLIDETVRLARGGLTPRIEVAVEPGEDTATIQGNFGALQQVLMNLMVNARDAMPGGGKLSISAKPLKVDEAFCKGHIDARPGRYHAIAVADTGSGIPRETIARIFDPFFTTKDVGKGTGLGLSTAVSIVRAHGGWIDVESAFGRGTTFRVVLPAIDHAPEAEESAA